MGLLLLSCQQSHAQIFGKFAKKLEEKIKERLNVPASTPKSTPSTPKKDNTNNNGTPTQEEGNGKLLGTILGKMGLGNMDFTVKPQSSYAFQMYGINKTTLISVKEKVPQIILTKTMIHLDQLYIGMTILDENEVAQSDKAIIILDPQQMAFFTFFIDKADKKTYFGMHLKEDASKIEPSTTANKPVTTKPSTASTKKEKTLTKTNRTKVILTVKCDGYETEGEKGEKITYWLAPQSSLAGLAEYNKAMKRYSATAPSIGNTNTGASAMNDDLEVYIKQGKVMLGHDILQTNGDQMLSEIYKVKADAPSSFSTAGYKQGL
jgi:hypothetical protein